MSRIVFSGGSGKFFQLAMAHENLENYYKTNFALMQHHKYSLTELENMIPWERDIYVTLLQQYIEEEKKNQNRDAAIYKALAETNQILVEIQKQLSLDFAMRIAQEKETIKNVKSAESKRKFAAKEKAVEGVQKFGAAANNVVGRVAAPIKSVFDKIKEFFGLILTGIVTNAAFTWLGDEKNREKLTTIFDWVGKIFVGLLLTVIVGKAIKVGN
jgi:hypothetical protein